MTGYIPETKVGYQIITCGLIISLVSIFGVFLTHDKLLDGDQYVVWHIINNIVFSFSIVGIGTGGLVVFTGIALLLGIKKARLSVTNGSES